MEQVFLNEKCKFYAREAKGEKQQMLYCNIAINSERFVISTGVKVIPNQFNVKKQRALVSNDLTELENRNNTIVNDTISFYRTKFTDFVNWLMCNPDKINECKQNIYNFVPMKKKNTNSKPTGSKKFEETLEYIFGHELELEVRDKTISEDRKDIKASHLKTFYEFLNLKNIPQIWESLNRQTYRDFSDYLVNEKKTKKGTPLNISFINNHLSTLKAVVNAVIDRDVKRTPIDTKSWKLVEKQITTSEKKSVNYIFSDEQLDSIIDLELDGNAAIIRDIFVFGCMIGQRPSDNVRLLKGEGKRFQSNGIEVFSLLPHKTRKTDKVAFVPIFNVELVDSIIDRFHSNQDYKDYLNKTDKQRNALNHKWIKLIFAKAGLNDTFEATKQQGNEVNTTSENQADTAHVYLARHYFITYMCKNGVSESDVIEMTGHTSIKQIQETYSHLSIEQQADKLTSRSSIQALAGNKQQETTTSNAELKALISDLKALIKQDKKQPNKTLVERYAEQNNVSIEDAESVIFQMLDGVTE